MAGQDVAGQDVAGPGAAGGDWRDSLATATDLALVGIAVTVAALPVVTVAAAVRTGSLAVRHLVDGEKVPPVAGLWRVFRRSVLPGLVASVVLLIVVAVLAVDAVALASGRVPGGPAVLVVTALVAVVVAAVAALTVVRLGRRPDGGWRPAVRWAVAAARRRPVPAAGCVGILAFGAAIAVLVPATAPLLPGYVLFALHVVVRRYGE